MTAKNKIIGISCMSNDFYKFFNVMMKKYTFTLAIKRTCHRTSILSKA